MRPTAFAFGAAIAISACSVGEVDTSGLAPIDGGQSATRLAVTSSSADTLPQPKPTSDSDEIGAAAPFVTTTAGKPATQSNEAALATSDANLGDLTSTDVSTDVPTSRIAAANAAPTASAGSSDSSSGNSDASNTLTASADARTQPPTGSSVLTDQNNTPRRTGIFARLFNNDQPTPPANVRATAPIREAGAVKAASLVPEAVSRNARSNRQPDANRSRTTTALPGVNRDRVLGIEKETGSRSSNRGNEIRLASAAGLARLTPNGLKTQHSGVDVKCLKPALVKLLKQVERKYGKSVIVTSGYRSPERNRRARGAKNSLHMYCAAADIQVPGVGKWDLAKYLRSLPGRGGVGTYCHTKSVHIDIGPRRDWNARCRRA